jgi:hypothetical protein
MKVVVLQPSYIPWRGFFHQIAKTDLFVFCDDVQYDKRGWRNRNRVKTPNRTLWLTIPVYNKGVRTEHIPIHQINICWDKDWNHDHWRTIEQSYHKAPYFGTYAPLLEPIFQTRVERLVDFTIPLTLILAEALQIKHTRFLRSSQIPGVEGAKDDRLLSILKVVGGTHYITGPSAKDYIREEKFQEVGISLEYMVYDYPAYPQLYPPYDPFVSILDLLFMVGPQALAYITPNPEASHV